MSGVDGHLVAAIPGDGIGKEVLPAAQRVLDAVAVRHGFALSWCELPWSCSWYTEHGAMMPPDGIDRLRETDAIFLGAVGSLGGPTTSRCGGCSSRSGGRSTST